MSGAQSVLNHLRFARHWLAKAENEFQRQEAVQGELTLSLVEAEVRKAWTESRSGVQLLHFPVRQVKRLSQSWAPAVAAAAALTLVLGGVAATRLGRSARPAAAARVTLPGAASQLVGRAVWAVPPAPAAISLPAAPVTAPVTAGVAALVAAPAAAPASSAVAATPEARPAPEALALPQQPAPTPAPAPAASQTLHPASAPAVGAAPAIAGEGGGTPLPLDVVELVRIAERSLTGRL
jgi:hypothetical protein